MLKPWFSFSENGYYSGNEPYFFDISSKPWKELLENNSQIILQELETLVNNNNKNIVPYFNQTLASAPTAWTVFPLIFWGETYTDNCKQVKKTVNIINQINGLISCGFSILKPHTSIKPHCGDSNVMYRCHLTLKNNGTIDEIGMRVGNEKVTWENGKLFAFCDAHNHEVWNNTDDERWIMIIDILREEFINDKDKICALVKATLWWQIKFQKNYFFKHLPNWSRKWLMYSTSIFMKN